MEKSEFRVVPDWPKLPRGWEWGKVSAVATDSKGRVYVGHRGEHPVIIFEPDGTFVGSLGDTEILPRHGIVYAPEPGENPVLTITGKGEMPPSDNVSPPAGKVLVEETLRFLHGVYVDYQDNLWVTDCGRSAVLKYGPDGALLNVLGTADEPGESENHFNQPTDVVVNREGEIFVTDGYVNSRIVKFSADGKFLKTWGKRGNGKGEFNTPHAITLDNNGTIHVSDRANYRIQIFDNDGKALGEWTDLALSTMSDLGKDTLDGLFLGNDGIFYGSTGWGNKIIQLDAEGHLLSVWGNNPSTQYESSTNLRRPPGQFNGAHGLCLDKDCVNLYVAEVQGHRVQKFERQ